ncbi:hypothetical protein AADZ91_03770 [Colwelliaceae bacterium 6441]
MNLLTRMVFILSLLISGMFSTTVDAGSNLSALNNNQGAPYSSSSEITSLAATVQGQSGQEQKSSDIVVDPINILIVLAGLFFLLMRSNAKHG